MRLTSWDANMCGGVHIKRPRSGGDDNLSDELVNSLRRYSMDCT